MHRRETTFRYRCRSMGPRAIRLRWLWRSRPAPRDTGLVAGSPSRDHTECSSRHGWNTGPSALLLIDFVAMCLHSPAVQLRRAITSGWPTTRVPSVNAVPFERSRWRGGRYAWVLVAAIG